MDINTKRRWIVDLATMTCRDKNNHIIVAFEKSGKAIVGKIKDISLEMMAGWAKRADGAKLMRDAVLEAEGAFLHAYFENKLEKNISKRFAKLARLISC